MGTFSEKHEAPVFSLITVNFQSASAVSRMIRSLAPGFLAEAEILVVNNDPNERALLDRLFKGHQRIRVIDSGSNVGFGAACNRGAREARTEILLFLNPDTRFVAGSLSGWAAEFASGQRSISAPVVMHDQQKEAWSSGRTISPMSILLQNIFPVARFWSWYAGLFPTDWVSGAAFMMHRSDFVAIGGFDERFFLYYEDVDLCRRAEQAGIAVSMSSRAVFDHRGGLSRVSRSSQKQAYFRSQDLYIGAYYGKGWVRMMRLLRSLRSPFLFEL